MRLVDWVYKLRIYGGGSKEGIVAELEVKNILYECVYLSCDFKNKNKTKMKKEYCKYCPNNGDYCWLYQYQDILDYGYHAIFKAAMEQLRITKEKIKNVITINKNFLKISILPININSLVSVNRA